MSDLVLTNDSSTKALNPCDSVRIIIEPHMKDLGGFSVRRVLPYREQQMVGPWIFFDHFGPTTFPAGQGIDVRPHPHINLATVTYLFEGKIHHRDSLGSSQTIIPGAINLMVAGKGITHSERESSEVRSQEHHAHGLQLWLALPEKDEEMMPAFYHYAADELPSVIVDGVTIRVMMGSAYGVSSPVKTLSDTLYVEANLKPGDTITLPDTVEECAVYMVKGTLKAKDSDIPELCMTVFCKPLGVELTAEDDVHLVIIGGKPLGPRHIWWNFVSSRKERIEEAKQDWREGRFAKVIGDEEEFIPLPE